MLGKNSILFDALNVRRTSNFNLFFMSLCFRVYLCKQWQELKVLNDHTAAATGIRFGKHAQYIASTSMDRTLKLYGLP